MSEPTNEDRADWGQAAIEAFAQETFTNWEDELEEDPGMVLGDLLADLRHWADVRGISYAAADANGEGNYLEELAEEEACDEV